MNCPCLYCGKEKQEKWDEMTKYYKCYCEKAKLKRKLKKQINELEMKIPKEKYRIIQKTILVKN